MSPTMGRGGKARPDRSAAGLAGAYQRPQVNLLPPEVRARRSLGRLKVMLAMALVVVLLAAVGAYAFAVLEARRADADLARVSEKAARLVAEQQQYREVPLIKSQVTEIAEARQFGASTEVLWAIYLRAIEAVAPEDFSLQSLDTTMPRPGEVLVPGMNPLGEPSVGTITFVGRSLTVPVTADWMDALERIPGFVDAWFTNAQITEESGVVYYEVGATIQVNTQVFANRFLPEDAEAESGSEPGDATEGTDDPADQNSGAVEGVDE